MAYVFAENGTYLLPEVREIRALMPLMLAAAAVVMVMTLNVIGLTAGRWDKTS